MGSMTWKVHSHTTGDGEKIVPIKMTYDLSGDR